MNKQLFRLIALEEASAYIDRLPDKAREKVFYNIRKVAAGIKDSELFKKLDNTDIWEFRTIYNGICYRMFAFWDNNIETLVIATHGIIKKTQKTPLKEIRKAETIRSEYFKNKRNK